MEQATQNICAILEAFGRTDIPVFIGAARPLVEPPRACSEFHGPDGLGGTGFGAIASTAPVRRGEPAALAIIRIARECAERGDPAPTVVTIGPTTNLALALRLEPSLPDLIGRVVIMGGAYLAQGNWGAKGATSGAAEYNAVTDPEALAIVMNELGSHV